MIGGKVLDFKLQIFCNLLQLPLANKFTDYRCCFLANYFCHYSCILLLMRIKVSYIHVCKLKVEPQVDDIYIKRTKTNIGMPVLRTLTSTHND